MSVASQKTKFDKACNLRWSVNWEDGRWVGPVASRVNRFYRTNRVPNPRSMSKLILIWPKSGFSWKHYARCHRFRSVSRVSFRHLTSVSMPSLCIRLLLKTNAVLIISHLIVLIFHLDSHFVELALLLSLPLPIEHSIRLKYCYSKIAAIREWKTKSAMNFSTLHLAYANRILNSSKSHSKNICAERRPGDRNMWRDKIMMMICDH